MAEASIQNMLIKQRNHLYQVVGQRIRELRDSKGMSQKNLADAVGLSRTSLTNIEKGRQKMLLHSFIEIADALGVSATELFPLAVNNLGGMNVKLPTSMPPEQRAFVERALNPGVHHESQNGNQNSRPSKSTPALKQNQRPARRR